MKIVMKKCPICGNDIMSDVKRCTFCSARQALQKYEQPAIGVYDPVRVMFIPRVTRIEILNPGKVLRFTFHDDSQIKTICANGDMFDPEMACYIAYAKMLNKRCFRNAYNAEGIVYLANDLRFEKCYEKLVTKAMKIYEKALTEYNSTRMVQINGKSPRDIMDEFLNAALGKSEV